MSLEKIENIITQVKQLSKQYRALTGKPLGITGEVAEFSAAKILGLTLCTARQPGYDAVKYENGKEIKVQIKGRCVLTKPYGMLKVGRLDFQQDWDIVLLVLLNDDFEVISIFEAKKDKIKAALDAPGSTARNVRGQLSISKFKSIGREIWSCQSN